MEECASVVLVGDGSAGATTGTRLAVNLATVGTMDLEPVWGSNERTLVVTVGESPLPVLLACLVLRPSHILAVVSSQSERRWDLVEGVLMDLLSAATGTLPKCSTVIVDAHDTCCSDVIAATLLGGPGRVHLAAVGGTNTMVAAAFGACLRVVGEETFEAWTLNAMTGCLQPTFNERWKRSVEPETLPPLSIADLVRLHSPGFELRPGELPMDLQAACRHAFDSLNDVEVRSGVFSPIGAQQAPAGDGILVARRGHRSCVISWCRTVEPLSKVTNHVAKMVVLSRRIGGDYCIPITVVGEGRRKNVRWATPWAADNPVLTSEELEREIVRALLPPGGPT